MPVAMPLIDPASLVSQPLRLRRTAEDDFAVLVADLIAGRIMRKAVAGGFEVWFWTLTGPYVPPQLRPVQGDAETLDEAKEAFKGKFLSWLHWAATQGGDVHWHVAVQRQTP